MVPGSTEFLAIAQRTNHILALPEGGKTSKTITQVSGNIAKVGESRTPVYVHMNESRLRVHREYATRNIGRLTIEGGSNAKFAETLDPSLISISLADQVQCF